MLVTALLNLLALLIRSVLSRALTPPAPDAAGTFSAAGNRGEATAKTLRVGATTEVKTGYKLNPLK